MSKLTLVVMAAGMGSRYGGLKQMDTMTENGDTIIDFSIYDAIQAGFKKVVFIVREAFIEQFKTQFDEKLNGKIEVEYVCQELSKIPEEFTLHAERIKPLGTGHALLVAKDLVKDNFVVINGDDFYSREAFLSMKEQLTKMDTQSDQMCMVGYHLNKTVSENGYVSRGECFVNDKNELTDVVERTHIEQIDGKIYRKDDGEQLIEMDPETTVSMNFWGFTPKFFEALEHDFNTFLKERGQELKSEFFIPLVVNNVIQTGKGAVNVLTSDAKWYGVTYKEDKDLVTSAIEKFQEKGVYPIKMWN